MKAKCVALIEFARGSIEPYASVMPVQFFGDDDGHLAVRERHAKRLAAVVHLKPPGYMVDGRLGSIENTDG